MRSWQKTQTFFLGLRIGGFAIVVLLKRAPRDAGMGVIQARAYGPKLQGWTLEGRFVGVAAAAVGRRPRVLAPAACAARRALTAGVAAAAVATAETAFAAGPAGPVDLGRSVPQRRADVVDLDLVDGSLLAFLGLVVPLLQPTGHDDPHSALKGLRDVLGRLPPYVAGEKEAVTVPPLTARGIAYPRRGRDAEGRNRLTGLGESEFRVGDKVADDRDRGVSCRHSGAPGPSRTDRWVLAVLGPQDLGPQH